MHLSVWAIAESVGVTVHVHVRVCVHASLSIQHGKKKNGICEYSVHFKPHFYHDTIVLELCIEKNYNKIVCYFFCGLSCRRKTKRATKVSNFQCFLICV